MKLNNLTPVKLRLVLISALLLLIALGVAAFILGNRMLAGVAQSSQEAVAKAEASNSSLQNLIETERRLKELSSTVDRADKLVSESKRYLYQDQIIKDINAYANEAGLKITNITFTDAKTTAVSGAAAPAVGGGGAAPGGVKSTTATVTLDTPIKYKSMLTFIHLIEQSLFRMQVSQIGISKGNESDGPDSVVSDILTIEVYVR